jgi:hypothetical protein
MPGARLTATPGNERLKRMHLYHGPSANCNKDGVSPGRRRAQPERTLQVALVEHLTWRASPDVWFSHFPGGGRRNVIDGANLKRMGVRPGTPDLLFVVGGRLYGLELKNGSKGRLSDTQVETHAAMRRAGAVIGTAGTVDEALDLLAEWGLLR